MAPREPTARRARPTGVTLLSRVRTGIRSRLTNVHHFPFRWAILESSLNAPEAQSVIRTVATPLPPAHHTATEADMGEVRLSFAGPRRAHSRIRCATPGCPSRRSGASFLRHGRFAEHYGARTASTSRTPPRLDYVVGRPGLTGRDLGGALEARQIPASAGKLVAEAEGEVELEGKTLVIKRIHVKLLFECPVDSTRAAERVHGFFAQGFRRSTDRSTRRSRSRRNGVPLFERRGFRSGARPRILTALAQDLRICSVQPGLALASRSA